MKIQTRELEKLEYVIFDLDKKTIYPVTLNMHLHAYQINQLKMYPRMMLDFAHYLGEYAKSNGVRNPMVKADIVVGMNGRKPQAVFSKDLDLLQVKWDKFGRNKWISPLNQE